VFAPVGAVFGWEVSPGSILPSQDLAGAGRGHAQQVFDLGEVVKFRLLVGGQAVFFGELQQVAYALLRFL
jgi:hypothetical protein